MRTALRIGLGLVTALGVSAAVMPAGTAAPGDGQPPLPGFLVRCGFSHSAAVDPIVSPGMSGASHLHEFFGNTGTDKDSTGTSLLNGSTTCSDPNNRSAYWVPALYQDGVRVAPQAAYAFYFVAPGRSTTAFPVGFKAVFGRSDQTAAWGCVTPGNRPVFGSSVATVPTCDGGARLVARISFGSCWDGSSLDSKDHASHLVFPTNGACPTSHAVRVPGVNLVITYPLAARGGSGVTLASGSAATMHADIFEAWTGTSQQERIDNAGVRRNPPQGGQPGGGPLARPGQRPARPDGGMPPARGAGATVQQAAAA